LFLRKMFGQAALCIFLIVSATMDASAKAPEVLKFTKNPLLPGKPIALSAYAGKPVLVVNVASECGFTGQYKDLEALHREYKDRGLVVLGIPANDFGGQESGSNAQIAQFCEMNYGVTFQMLEKISTPIAKDPFYAALIKASGETPQWNFHKYLIDRRGNVQSFSSNVAPKSAILLRALDSALRN
jgi:glutathione peroxidase